MSTNREDFHVCEFTVIRDTREQAPWHFQDIPATKEQGGGINLIDIIDRAMLTGDYSIQGLEDQVSVERKSIPDLLNCIVGDRKRFRKQLDRLNAVESGHVVVEGDWLAVFRETEARGKVPRMTLVSVISWAMRYVPSVHWWFMPGKRPAEIMAFRILEYAHKMRGLGILKDFRDDGEEKRT